MAKRRSKRGVDPYRALYWGALTEDELAMVDAMAFSDEEMMITEQLKLLSLREARLMRRIAEAERIDDGLHVDNVTRRDSDAGAQGKSETTVKSVSILELIKEFEAELTRVQARKTQCIALLQRIRLDRKRHGAYSEDPDASDPFLEALNGNADVWSEGGQL